MNYPGRVHGDIPQMNRGPQGPGIKPLFHSVRDIALILDKTLQAGYGVLKTGTVLAENNVTKKLVPYSEAAANANNTNAKAYLIAAPEDAQTYVLVTVADSYKFAVGDPIIADGTDTGTAEVQHIACVDALCTTADVFTLTFGSTTLTATIGATQTTLGLLALLQAHADYAAAPFVLTGTANTRLILTWKAVGVIATKAVLTETGETPIDATTSVAGVDIDPTGTTAEDLGLITVIDRTYASSTQAKITFSTAVTTGARFNPTYYGCVYVKGAGESSTPFTKAKYVLDKDVDTGEGAYAKGGVTSVVVSNAVLYTASLVGMDSAAVTDLGAVTDGRFTILK